MRIVFLDVDGVLNNCHTTDRICHFYGVDDYLISRLATLINESNKTENTNIVLVSTWRLEWESSVISKDISQKMYDYLVEKLKEQDLNIFSSTKYIQSENRRNGFRYREIEEWLEDHKSLNISSWCILDDEEYLYKPDIQVPDLPGYKNICSNKLVLIDEYYGLSEEDVQKALLKLKEE